MFKRGVSNARYAYLIDMKIDGEWQRISTHFSRYREAYEEMLHFAGDHYPWDIMICRTISLKNI